MSYIHLNRDDRIRLATLLKAGLNISACAFNLGYSRQTISREVKINGGSHDYDPHLAQKKARRRRLKANQHCRKFCKSNWYTRTTIRLLSCGWSPEQITGRFRLEREEEPFCKSTIYNNVNRDKDLAKLLPRKHNKYRRRADGNERKRQREVESKIKSIDIRPEHINKREEIGHWEGDTIIGKEKTKRILTHVERKTGYLIANLLSSVSSEIIKQKTIESFQDIPKEKRTTFTYDNGLEFADWELIERELENQIFFAHPYHSWERGTNENTNGLIRRYYPKKTLFANIKEEELKNIVKQINQRPRKRLGYQSPYEMFHSVKLRTLI